MDAARRFGLILPFVACVVAAGCSGGATGRSTPPVATESRVVNAEAAVRSTGPVQLRRYAIDRDKVFVAGISSGGFFGVQMHVAHSATFKGAAIYAGGVYYCALGNIVTALTACGGEGLYAPTLAASEAYLDLQSHSGTIDPESNLRGQPVYLWSGKNDTVVSPHEMDDLNTEYGHYGANIVRYDNAFPAQHGWESPAGELGCGTLGSPFMIRCDSGGGAYDSEAVWMKAFFGQGDRHGRGDRGDRDDRSSGGKLINFDQTAFGASASNSMDTNGYVFVPNGCNGEGDRGGCGLVVAFHGCLQTQADIGTKFITESGINEWAARYHVVVLYPYAVKSATAPLNPNGCWDWWGYDDPNYALKSGTQVSIVYKMVQRLMGH
jgi:poly(3-hydroxybutyrate) depolymerase